MVLFEEGNRLSAKQAIQAIQDLLLGMGRERLGVANEISRLAKNSAKARAHLGGAGVIVPLVSMLKSSSRDPKEAAFSALLNLAIGNERNKIRIIKAGVLQPMVELLQSEDANLKENATAAFLTLSDAAANRQVIGLSGAIPLLVRLLSSGSIQAKIDAVLALHNLSTCPGNRSPILMAGAVSPLLDILKGCRKSSKVAAKIMAILESLMSFEEGRSCVVREEGGLLAMVEVLEEGTLSGQEHAVGALLTMCESDKGRFRGAILEEGAIPGLLVLSVQGIQQAQYKAHRLLELLRSVPQHQRVAWTSSAPRTVIIENIVSEICTHVDNTEPSGRGSAKTLLMDMLHLSTELNTETSIA